MISLISLETTQVGGTPNFWGKERKHLDKWDYQMYYMREEDSNRSSGRLKIVLFTLLFTSLNRYNFPGFQILKSTFFYSNCYRQILTTIRQGSSVVLPRPDFYLEFMPNSACWKVIRHYLTQIYCILVFVYYVFSCSFTICIFLVNCLLTFSHLFKNFFLNNDEIS